MLRRRRKATNRFSSHIFNVYAAAAHPAGDAGLYSFRQGGHGEAAQNSSSVAQGRNIHGCAGFERLMLKFAIFGRDASPQVQRALSMQKKAANLIISVFSALFASLRRAFDIGLDSAS